MALPGYLLGDLWERPSFVKEVLAAQEELKSWTRGSSIAIAFGGLGVDEHKTGEDGRIRKYIAFYLVQNGEYIGPENGPYPFSIKTLLPNYREFDDGRHFCRASRLAEELDISVKDLIAPHTLSVRGKEWSLGPLLCEDSWSQDYSLDPTSILVEKGIDILLNLSSSPFTKGKSERRDRLFKAQAVQGDCPIFYCNATGIQNNGKTIYTFDGDSCVYNRSGERAQELPLFEQGATTVDLGSLPKPVNKSVDDMEVLYKAIRFGTASFLEQTGISKVVIGASGGIDSALVAAIYADILPRESLLLINMPSRFNTSTTVNAAKDLAKRLGCLYGSVEIESSVNLTQQQLDGFVVKTESGEPLELELKLSSFVMENVQARDRSGRILAAISAAFGGAFTCNANKSETSVGYSTLYGDHAGFLANISDLWKGEVYGLSKYMNEKKGREIIPQSILDVKPTAELSDQQNPEQNQGDPFFYPYHDALFRCWVEDWNRKSPEEVLESYMNGDLAQWFDLEETVLLELFPTDEDFVNDLERWWRCYAGMGVAKRIQAPPILAVSRRAYGFDQRDSQTKVLWTKAYLELKEKLLFKG
jgi:NAD+ synthase (glutamine-hydrolysing)